ncbi:chitinase 3 [Cordyceps fumosorosea ARSEF 2679]|uniref:chitinase n=1 Tax=Cordyceps fumosorosea (strain ARSEF 2679) TaxID=1081104 RepID=A0A168CKT0_CORFA|nr:chitinase 3 [Cordyceps fumosorosea ARSEF 2679]OAA71496.1 chitinase 3 [Cordyceps fumosorosea ARSEF 2679]
MSPLPPRPTDGLPRLITYYQTLHDDHGKPISILPLITQPGIAVTHVILAALHVNEDPDALTLNDHSPDDPRHQTAWAELRVLQAAGVRVLALLGGAAKGTYERLDVGPDDSQDPAALARFERYYAPVRDLVRARGLDGLDLDVEEDMSLAGIVRLIDRLRADFGPDFIITLAPVAASLLDPTANLSGFDYEALEVLRGREIAWYNAQFYWGWGDFSSPAMYDVMVRRGWRPERLVVGLVTNPANGSGFVAWESLEQTLAMVKRRPHGFGGIMGWEYFNSLPGDRDRPWEWARTMTALIRAHCLPPPGADGPKGGGAGGPAPASEAEGKEAPAVEADPDPPGGKEAGVPGAFEYYTDDAEE